MAGEYNERLKKMQETWDSGREQAPTVPPGLYTMQLQSAEVVASQSSGKLMIRREHLILEGEHENTVVYDYLMIETEKGPFWIARWLESMDGEAPEQATELPAAVEEVAGRAPIYTGKVVVSNGGFTNVRIVKLLDSSGSSGAAGPDPEVGEDPTSAQEAGDGGGFQEGDSVAYDDADGDECQGEIVRFDDDEDDGRVAIVKDADDDEWSVPLADLRAADGGGGGDEDIDALIAFAQQQDIEVSNDDDRDAVVEKIKEYQWPKKDLEADQIALLESIDADFEVAKPKPKKAPKKAPKKPAKKAAAKKAKPKKSGKKRK